MRQLLKKGRYAFAAAGITLLTGISAAADPIATVLAIKGNASGPQGAIAVGDRLEDGLIIRTNAKTQIELEFDDGTLMAIGPNSELEVSAVLMNSTGTANRFAVNAVAGSFRLLSGDSERDAYEITTPASTIGIRGTEFDIAVAPAVTGVVLYRGALELCLTGSDKCWAFRGSCYVAEADLDRNRVRGIRANDALGYLSNFIYAQTQFALTQQLHTNINACDKYDPDNEDDRIVEEVEESVEEETADETDVESDIVIDTETDAETETETETESESEEASTDVSCEFDGEGFLCYDPVEDRFFYDFSLEPI